MLLRPQHELGTEEPAQIYKNNNKIKCKKISKQVLSRNFSSGLPAIQRLKIDL
jgi:hypothetical protein